MHGGEVNVKTESYRTSVAAAANEGISSGSLVIPEPTCEVVAAAAAGEHDHWVEMDNGKLCSGGEVGHE